jgi:dTDP-4-dehydrorhamnose reductase
MGVRDRDSVLVVGGTGLLGGALVRALARPAGEGAPAAPAVAATWRERPPTAADRATGAAWARFELADPSAAATLLEARSPRVVVHAAVPARREDYADALVLGAARLAAAARAHGATFVHVSSDMVFDGASGPFAEDAPLSPITEYGRAKADAERAVRAADPAAIVVRAPLLYRLHPPDRGLARWLDGLARGDAYPLFEDEIRCPAHVDDVAAALVELADRAIAGGPGQDGATYHAVGPVAVSRYALGTALLAALGMDPARAARCRLADSGLVRPRELVLTTGATPRWLTAHLRAPAAALAAAVTTGRAAPAAPRGGRGDSRA